MKVGIVGQRDNARAVSLAGRLAERLDSEGVAVVVDESTAAALAEDDWLAELDARTVEEPAEFEDCTLLVSIGGDGTFLYAARRAGPTPVLGVNLGEVGFLNAVSPADAVETVLAELDHARETGAVRSQTMPRLAARGDGWTLEPAINEVVIEGPRRGHGGGARFTVGVDDAEYTTVDADGVLVTTPTGSTAYNLSEGGPLVHPTVPALIVTLMAPAEGLPSLVVGEDDVVTVAVADAPEGMAVSDGRVRQRLDPPERVTLEVADEPTHIAGPSRDFFAALGKLE